MSLRRLSCGTSHATTQWRMVAREGCETQPHSRLCHAAHRNTPLAAQLASPMVSEYHPAWGVESPIRLPQLAASAAWSAWLQNLLTPSRRQVFISPTDHVVGSPNRGSQATCEYAIWVPVTARTVRVARHVKGPRPSVAARGDYKRRQKADWPCVATSSRDSTQRGCAIPPQKAGTSISGRSLAAALHTDSGTPRRIGEDDGEVDGWVLASHRGRSMSCPGLSSPR